jgi:hypothetical protein
MKAGPSSNEKDALLLLLFIDVSPGAFLPWGCLIKREGRVLGGVENSQDNLLCLFELNVAAFALLINVFISPGGGLAVHPHHPVSPRIAHRRHSAGLSQRVFILRSG